MSAKNRTPRLSPHYIRTLNVLRSGPVRGHAWSKEYFVTDAEGTFKIGEGMVRDMKERGLVKQTQKSYDWSQLTIALPGMVALEESKEYA